MKPKRDCTRSTAARPPVGLDGAYGRMEDLSNRAHSMVQIETCFWSSLRLHVSMPVAGVT